MRKDVERLWPELAWIENPKLREQVTQEADQSALTLGGQGAQREGLL